MKEKKKLLNNKTFMIILISVFILLIAIGVTYAWYVWNSTDNTNITMQIGEYTTVTFTGGNEINATLYPVYNYTDGESTTFTLTNNQGSLEKYNYSVYLDINSVPSKLKTSSLKYVLLDGSNNIVDQGDFSSAESTSRLTVTENKPLPSGSSSYTFIIYLDGNVENPTSAINNTIDCTLRVMAKRELLADYTDFVYVLGSNQTTISQLSSPFYNRTNESVSDQNNVSLSSPISINSNEILLVRYIGSETKFTVPNTFEINGNTYNTVVLSYATDGSNLDTGLFYHNNSIQEITFQNNIKMIASNSSNNGYDLNSMSNMFNGCTHLTEVNSIPNTITNMSSTFFGCTSMETSPSLSSGVTNINNIFSGCNVLSNIDLSNVDLNIITTYVNAFNGISNYAIINLRDCAQYSLFISKFGTSYTGLNVANNNNPIFNCYYQKVEYIQSSGTQYIDTGFKHNQDTRVLADIDFQPEGTWKNPFGSYGGANASPKKMFAAQYDGNNTLYLYYGNASSQSITTKSGYTGRKIWDFNKNVWKIGTTTKTFATQTFQSQFNFFIFANSAYSGQVANKTNVALYSFKIYDNEVLVRDFVPCYTTTTVTNSEDVQVSSGTVGLYDTVNNVFYSNADTSEGAVDFTKGPDVNSA